MTNTITALTTSVSADALWSVYTDAVPLIAVCTLVALGFYIVNRLLKGISHERKR